MKTMLKPILLSAAALVAVMFIVFCGAHFWINSSHGRRWVQARIDTAIPGSVTIENHQLSLLDPELNLNGVVLLDTSGNPLAGFSHFHIRLDWWALWRREVRIEAILLQAPWVDLVVGETSGLNLMAALVPPAQEKESEVPSTDVTGLPFNIVIKSVQLTDGRLSFTPSDSTLHLETTGINLSADGDLMARSGSLGMDLTSVLFSSADIHPEPARIVLNTRLDQDRLSISTLDITSGQTVLRCSGSVLDLYKAPVIDGVISADSQLAELKTIFDLAGDYSGPVSAKLTMKGSVANPDAGLVLVVENSRLAGQPVDHGDLSINMKDRQVEIESAAFRLADGEVRLNGTADLRGAFPTGFLASPADVNLIAYNLNMVQDTPDLNPWLNRFIDLSGRMTSRLSIHGKGVTSTGMSAELSLNGSGHDLLAPGMDQPVDADIDLSAQMDRGKITLSGFDAAVDGVELSGNGRFQMDDGSLAGNLSLTADDLSRALAVVGIPSVSGACSVALTVDGSLNQPQFSLYAASQNLKVEAYTLGNLTVDANMDHDGVLKLNTLTLENSGSRIRGNGRLRLVVKGDGIDPGFVNTLGLSLEKVSPANFMESPPVNGSIDIQLQLDGPLDSLNGELSLNGRRLTTDVAVIGDLDARMKVDAGTLVVERLLLNNRNSTLTTTGKIRLLAPGTLRLVEDPSFTFTADSTHFDPGDFIDAISGHFTFNGALEGSVQNPVGRVTLAGRQINLAGQAIETLSIDARFEERRLWLDRLVAAVVPGEQIEGRGSIGVDKTIDLNVKAEGITVSRIQKLQDIFPGKGMLHVDVSARGTMENPDIDGSLTISDIIANDSAIEDVNLTFSLHDMLAKITGNLNFDMDAVCDLRKGDFDVRLAFDRTETAAYFKAAGKPRFHGSLTGRVEAAGNIRDAANVSALLDLDDLRLLFDDIRVVQSNKISLTLAEKQLSISEFEATILDEGHLLLKGDARLDGRLNMTVDGRIPLAAARVFSEDLVQPTGMLTLAGNITGEAMNPQIDGRINLDSIGMQIPGLTQRLNDLNGSIHLTTDSIRIDALSGFWGTGSFSVGGSVVHERLNPKRVDLVINARTLPLEIPGTLTVLLNGDISITGSDNKADARGEIVVLEGVYYKDVKINLLQVASTATTRQRTVAPASTPLSIPYFDTVNLNISIGHRQPFEVENNLAELKVSPDLKIEGTLANPIVSGRARIGEGDVFFQRKTFEVKKGVIDFINPYKTEPEIDVACQVEIRTWTINLIIKGTPDNLDIELTSVPSETESDILSLILFGRTARELSAGEGGAQRTTGQIMAEMIAGNFGDDIKESTGVDILQVESSDSSEDNDAGGVKVTVGKHLSDRMTVKYAIETKNGEMIQRAITEYKLMEHMLVSGFQDTRGVFGSELTLRIEFR